MTPEEAFNFVNGLFLDKTHGSLNCTEREVFIGIYKGLSYERISNETHYKYQSIKEIGSKLLKKLENTFKIKVNKGNLQPTIEQLWKQHSEKSQSSQTPLTELTSAAVQEILPPAFPPQLEANLIVKNDLGNPFIPWTGRIDDPQQFFNRHREIKQVFEHLNSNHNVVLIGEEGIGKSSLLWEICRQSENRLSSPRKSIYLNMQLVDNDVEFYSYLCEEIGIPNSQGQLLNRALQQHQLLLLIDNVGKMAREGFTLNLRDRLRGLTEISNKPLQMILAAGELLDQLFQDESRTSPFSGIFLEEHLQPWDEVTARAFIKNRLETTLVLFTEEEITQLVQESAGHPRRLMQLCYKTYARYME